MDGFEHPGWTQKTIDAMRAFVVTVRDDPALRASVMGNPLGAAALETVLRSLGTSEAT